MTTGGGFSTVSQAAIIIHKYVVTEDGCRMTSNEEFKRINVVQGIVASIDCRKMRILTKNVWDDSVSCTAMTSRRSGDIYFLFDQFARSIVNGCHVRHTFRNPIDTANSNVSSNRKSSTKHP